MQSMAEYRGKDAEIFFIGFWVDRGTCDISVINMLSELQGKKVALFGTCGLGNGADYYKSIEQKVKVWIPDDCEYLGAFLCELFPIKYGNYIIIFPKRQLFFTSNSLEFFFGTCKYLISNPH